MDGTIVLYTSAEHLNPMLLLANFIAKHHPSLPIIVLSFADDSAAAAVAAVPSITYRRLAAVAPPPNSINNHIEALYEIPRLSNPNLRAALEEISQSSRIRVLVIDFFCNYAFEVGTALGIPTYFYITTGSHGVAVFLYLPTIDETIAADLGDFDDFLEIPGFPTIHSSDMPQVTFRRSSVYKHVLDTARNMRRSSGILTNGFDAIEFRAKEAIMNGLCVPGGPTPPVYLVGPVVGDGGGGGERNECLRWLDQQPSKSVVFLCFGRRGLHSGEQLREMAVALERSGCRFLWSVRNPPEMSSPAAEPDLGELLPEGFLARTEERGFVVKSWAPQWEVLSHDSVAGFVTHCGRNSVLEAVANGVPMIGWPMYAEQRMNRVFVVEEMKASLPLEEAEGGFVTAAELERRVRELMESQTGRDIRRRVAEMKTSAAAAMRENGSSVAALQSFVNSLTR